MTLKGYQMQNEFNVPSFFHPEFDMSNIQKVESHIHSLKLQMCAYNFLKVFEQMPDIKSFAIDSSYESNDEGGSYLSLSTYNIVMMNKNQENEGEDEDFEDEEDSEQGYELNDFLYEVKDDECEYFFESLTGETITRKNIAKLVRKAMGEKEYDAWQSMMEKYQLEKTVAQSDKKGEIQKI